MERTELAKRLIYLRETYNLSQEDLSRIAGVSKAAVSFWETGDVGTIRSKTIKRICTHFPELNPAWLLGFDVPMMRQSDEAMELGAIAKDKIDSLDENQLRKLLKFMEEFL